MQIIKKIVLLCLSIFVATIYSCTTTESTPNVSNIKVELNPIRFDKLMYSINPEQAQSEFMQLQKKHPLFAEVFANNMMQWGNIYNPDDTFFNSVKFFLTQKDFVELDKLVNKKFPDTKNINEQVKSILQYTKHYFPKYFIPQLYYYNSGLLVQVPAMTFGDSILGIGLQMYLGSDYKHYADVQLPSYQIAKCTPEYIAPSVAATIYGSMYPVPDDGKTLLNLMIQRGKKLYFMHKVLPQTKDNVIIGFTPKQMEWCEKNREMVWSMFKANELLYMQNMQKTMPYVSEGPSSQGLPPEAPGNVGSWIGYEIVKAYMQKNTNVTLQQLLEMPVAEADFLQKSGYSGR